MVLTRQEMPTIPAEARKLFREGQWTQRTNGICVGSTNANLCTLGESPGAIDLTFVRSTSGNKPLT